LARIWREFVTVGVAAVCEGMNRGGAAEVQRKSLTVDLRLCYLSLQSVKRAAPPVPQSIGSHDGLITDGFELPKRISVV
jgi:hypothetical protein